MFAQFKQRHPHLKHKWDEYDSYFNRIEVPAKTILLKEGDISRKAFVVEKGCLRSWFNNNGKDVTFQFAFENEMFSGAESFRKSIPSAVTIETIEPSTLYWIHKNDMDKMMGDLIKIPEMSENLINQVYERQYNYMRHFLSLIKDTPEQRYLNLIKEKPHIVHRVPQQHIATYLGITPVSLSRIRNRLAK